VSHTLILSSTSDVSNVKCGGLYMYVLSWLYLYKADRTKLDVSLN